MSAVPIIKRIKATNPKKNEEARRLADTGLSHPKISSFK